MKNSLKTASYLCLLSFCVTACPPSSAQSAVTEESKRSCGKFVQAFYDWYVTRAKNEDCEERALQSKRFAFSPKLVRALREGRAAAARNQEVGLALDGDLFLDAQELSERYVTGEVGLKGNRCWVAVYSVDRGIQSPKPKVTPELVFDKRRWVFVNFHYSDPPTQEDENLLSLIRSVLSSTGRR